MTKDSAEEKMFQVGRKKMALDEALINSMDLDDAAAMDVESILKHGAKALFENDDSSDIHYDSASVDKLLDRTVVEADALDTGKTAGDKFSFARVWANDRGTLDVEDSGNAESTAPDFEYWEQTLSKRLETEAAETKQPDINSARTRRTRKNVNYGDNFNSPGKAQGSRRGHKGGDDPSDENYRSAEPTDEEEDEIKELSQQEQDDAARELQADQQGGRSRSKLTNQGTNGKALVKSLKPSKPTTSGKMSKEPAKVQQRVQKSMNTNMAKKAGVRDKPQPTMGTAVKQSNPAKNDSSSVRTQPAQVNGRTAMPQYSKTQMQLNIHTSGKKQRVHISGLPARTHGVEMSAGGKQSASLSGLRATPPSTPQPPKAGRVSGKKQVVPVTGLPAKPNCADQSQSALQSVAGFRPAAGNSQATPVVIPSESSDQCFRSSSKTGITANDLLHPSTQQAANTASVQDFQAAVDPKSRRNSHAQTPLDTILRIPHFTQSLSSQPQLAAYPSVLKADTNPHILSPRRETSTDIISLSPNISSFSRESDLPERSEYPCHTSTPPPTYNPLAVPRDPPMILSQTTHPAERVPFSNDGTNLRSPFQDQPSPQPQLRKNLDFGQLTRKAIVFNLQTEVDPLTADREKNAEADHKLSQVQPSTEIKVFRPLTVPTMKKI